MTLEEIIQNNLMTAMKAKDEVQTNTLRSVKTTIMEKRTAPGFKGELSDGDIIKIMQKMVKEREEVAEVYNSNHRQELADKELAEAEIIKEYLPKQMDEVEVEKIIKQVISDINASSIKDMGKVMGAATKQLNGQADGKTISGIVKRLLS